MKKIIPLLLATLLTMQSLSQIDYRKQITDFESKNRIKEGLACADSMLNKALMSNNQYDYVFATIYKLKFLPQIYELTPNNISDSIKLYIDRAPTSAKPALKLFQADYWSEYYIAGKYIIDQKPDDGIENKTLEEMSKHDFQRHITKTIDEAIELAVNEHDSLKKYNELYDGDEYFLRYYPMLYDQIIYQGINMIKQFDNNGYEFDIDRIIDINNTKSESKIVSKILELYAIWYKLNASNRDITGYIELKRAELINNRNNSLEKNDIYESILKSLLDKYTDTQAEADIELALTNQYLRLSNRYNSSDTATVKYYTSQNKALERATSIVNKYQNNYISQQAKNIIQQIENKEFSITTQKYHLARKNIAVSINYKNITTVKLTIKESTSSLVYLNSNNLKAVNAKVVYETTLELPKTTDHYNHTTTALLPLSKPGAYILEATTTNGFNDTAITAFQVSNLNFFCEPADAKNSTVWIVNAESGTPLKAASLELLTFDYQTRKKTRNKNIKVTEKYIISNGKITVETKKLTSAHAFRVTSNGDTLINHLYPPNIAIGKGMITDRIELFTDRAIYRPGQTIAVKGIWYRGDNNNKSVVGGAKVSLSLRDNNYTEIGVYSPVTNEFGSFSLTIPIPENIMPGYMTLNTAHGSINIRIESYRRYSFDAEFINPDTPTKKGDEVVIDFVANTYSGVKLNTIRVAGQVTFRSYLVWWLPQDNKAVTYIDTVAGDDGRVKICFKTFKNIGYQHYDIKLTATTPAGESREFTHTYTISDYPFELSLDKENMIFGDKLPNINIGLINNQLYDNDVELYLEKLKAPKNILLKLQLPTPDKHLISSNDWQKLMPQIEYSNELNYNNYSVENKVWNFKGKPSKAKFPAELTKNLDEGIYKLTLLAEGKRYSSYFTVMNPTKNGLSLPTVLDIYADKKVAKPDTVIAITFVSAVKEANLWYGITAGNKTIEQQRRTIKNGKLQIKFKVTPQHEGAIYVNAVVAYGGIIENKQLVIEVPRRSKHIDIETITMRKRIETGKRETWKFRLKNPDGHPVNAEIMALMYDKSLDAFESPQAKNLRLYYQTINTTLITTVPNPLSNNRVCEQIEMLREPLTIYWNFLNFSNIMHRYDFENCLSDNSLKSVRAKQLVNESTPMLFNMTQSDNYLEISNIEEEEIKPVSADKQAKKNITPQLRTNFNETAFFYPFINHDGEGQYTIEFEAPESLTSWRFQQFVHDKNMSTGYFECQLQTSKPLMVVPLFPRFLYTSDSATITAMVYNLTDSVLEVTPGAEFDFDSRKNITVNISDTTLILPPGTSTQYSVTFEVPTTPGFITSRLFCRSDSFSDGEETMISVLSNKKLIVNTLALWGDPSTKTKYKFDNILPDKINNDKKTKVTISMTTNPTWYAIQALPFFDNPDKESPFRLIESIFSIQVGRYLIEQYPDIAQTINIWQKIEPTALESKLLANSSLKIANIEKSPWFIDAQNERETNRKIGLFLEKNRVKNLTDQSIINLLKQQHSSGYFSWRLGWFPSDYATSYVVELIARLKEIDPDIFVNYPDLKTISTQSEKYIDNELRNNYQELLKSKTDTATYVTPYYILRYLYIKSLLNSSFKPTTKAEKYYHNHAKANALKYNLYGQAILGTLSCIVGDKATANLIYKSLDGSAVVSKDKGIFWRQNIYGWEWFEAPISTHVRIMEFYKIMQVETPKIEAMKIWLISNKHTRMWSNEVATAEAVYALVSIGQNWLGNNNKVSITLSDIVIDNTDFEQQQGSGYFQTTIENQNIPEKIDRAVIDNQNSNPVYGGVFVSFFENHENIKSWQQNLAVEAKYFMHSGNDTETILTEIKGDTMAFGGKVRMRLTISSDRTLEYVVVKIPIASCFEQVDQTSGYRWKSGQRYYQQNYDDQTELYIHRLEQGITVLELDLYTLRRGRYSSAPPTVQSIYAPEFSAHTQGVKTVVE